MSDEAPVVDNRTVVDVVTNGINVNPGDDESWTDRYCTWTIINTTRKVQSFEYYARTLSRRWFSSQQKRAEKLARMMGRFVEGGCRLNCVGHSNGCDILMRALALLPDQPNRPVVEDLHLFNAASASDAEKSLLNKALLTAKVWRVMVYVGGSDHAMQVANWLPWFYGDMGFAGPNHVSSAVPFGALAGDAPASDNLRLVVRTYPDFGHSDFWALGRFEKTMRLINGLYETNTPPGPVGPAPES